METTEELNALAPIFVQKLGISKMENICGLTEMSAARRSLHKELRMCNLQV